MVQAADGAFVLFEDVERVATIVAKMRDDLTKIVGFDNRLIGQHAVNIREHITDLESILGAAAIIGEGMK